MMFTGVNGGSAAATRPYTSDARGGKNVWVVDSETQRVQSRQVVADEMVDDRIRVTAGLQPGEVIAVSAAQSLREGMRVSEMANLGEL